MRDSLPPLVKKVADLHESYTDFEILFLLARDYFARIVVGRSHSNRDSEDLKQQIWELLSYAEKKYFKGN